MENASYQTATARVCSIPELAEIILIHLAEGCSAIDGREYALQRFKTLFRLQRVIKTFEGVIIGSKALHRAMLLESDSVATTENTDINTVQCNPLLWSLRLKLVKEPDWRVPTDAAGNKLKWEHIIDFDRKLEGDSRVPSFVRSKSNSFPAAFDALQKHKSETWRKTLIWNAPLPIRVCIYGCCDFEEWVRFEGGSSMGKFVDETNKALGKFEDHECGEYLDLYW